MYSKLSSLYYVLTKPVGKSLNGDIEFYENYLSKDKINLEVAVGSGRVLIPFLEKDYQIEGIDLSSEMLSLCEQECMDRNLETNLYLGNIASFKPNKTYERIIIPSGSFSLFENIDLVIENISYLLNKNAKLIFDIVYPIDLNPGQVFTYEQKINENKKIILKDSHIEINKDDQYSLQRLDYYLYENDFLIQKESEDFKLYYYDLEQIKHKLKQHGLLIEKIYADYKKEINELSEQELITIVAVKI